MDVDIIRTAVHLAHQRIAERDCPPTADGIRGFRHAITGNETDPPHGPCVRWRDFFSLSECRDLLFHAREHQFTTGCLQELIAAPGLDFMRFDADGFTVNATPTITNRQSLVHWGEFENVHSDLLGSMYIMWPRKPR